jgi:hypothetical protein
VWEGERHEASPDPDRLEAGVPCQTIMRASERAVSNAP